MNLIDQARLLENMRQQPGHWQFCNCVPARHDMLRGGNADRTLIDDPFAG
jgi:hypothetical protein